MARVRTSKQIAEEYLRESLTFHPDGMLQVLFDAVLMAEEMQLIAQAMQVRYDRACEYPLAAAIKDLYQRVAATQERVAAAAGEIAPMIGRLHERELDRLRNPRAGEQMWDVGRNRDA